MKLPLLNSVNLIRELILSQRREKRLHAVVRCKRAFSYLRRNDENHDSLGHSLPESYALFFERLRTQLFELETFRRPVASQLTGIDVN